MPAVATAPAPRSLLDRRLVIVTGKGGTGKTSVAAALSLAAAASGRRVLLAEVGRDEHATRILAPGSEPVGYEGRELRRGLRVMRIEPFEALAEYLGLQLRVRAAIDLVFRNRAFRQLMDASPGWRELITLGKVWHLQQMKDERGRPRFDLIVIDAPATGHGLTFLDVPRVVVSAVQSGPLQRNAALVEAMVQDPDDTLLLPIALPEELPARETVELVDRVRRDLGIAVDRVVVNAIVAKPTPPGLDDLDARLGRIPAETPLPGLPAAPALAGCIAHLRSRSELHAQHLRAIGEDTALPTIPLPYLAEGVHGPDALMRLARLLVPEAKLP